MIAKREGGRKRRKRKTDIRSGTGPTCTTVKRLHFIILKGITVSYLASTTVTLGTKGDASWMKAFG